MKKKLQKSFDIGRNKNSLKKKIIAIVPARSGSKGIRDKNLKKISKFSLLNWTIKAALKSKRIKDVYVSTDSKEYAEKSIGYGAKVPFLRPKNISKDNSIDLELFIHAVNEIIKIDKKIKYVVHLRPTTPFRDPKILDRAIQAFEKNKNFHSLRSVQEMSESAIKSVVLIKKNQIVPIKKKKNNLDYYNKPRQIFEKTYIYNGYIDVYKIDFIRKKKLLLGKKVFAFKTPNTLEIDSINDLQMCRMLINYDKNLKNIKRKIFKK